MLDHAWMAAERAKKPYRDVSGCHKQPQYTIDLQCRAIRRDE